MQRRIFITGTDTGVGKTILTALLAASAKNVTALKPFCSGERTDAELLAAMCAKSVDGINPWFYDEAVSPWTAARKRGAVVPLGDVVAFVRSHSGLVLIEGAGGVMSPLGDRFTAVELIRELGCEVILVAVNRLGVLNQVALALAALRGREVKVVLMEFGERDSSTVSNLLDLSLLHPGVSFVRVPFLKGLRKDPEFIRSAAAYLSSELDSLLIEAKKNPLDTEAEGTFFP